MRAVLIVNPHATATTERRRDLLARALAAATDLRVVHTEYRGHATELAADARAHGAELVVVHGGDGTVNETVNGLLAAGPKTPDMQTRDMQTTCKQAPDMQTTGAQPDIPLLAVVPGGSTNVFARAVGMDPDPTIATEQILEALADLRTITVSVGRANDRYFTFNAGLGLDAEVVKSVEQHRARGKAISNSLHMRRAVRTLLATDRHHPHLTVTIDGERTDDVHVALISNVNPWSYAGKRPVRTNPELPMESELGVLALRRLRIATVLRILRQLLARHSGPKASTVVRRDHAREVVVRTDEPTPLQVDGDYVGEQTEVTFFSVPATLHVLV